MNMKTDKRAIYYTARELSERGKERIPDELISNRNLIYSSPAALAFNSPGAEGFGVKRAGLSVPDSVMLIVAPGCCGRNTSSISSMPGYEDRFFYLLMNETDLVTARHLKKIPRAVQNVLDVLAAKGKRPSAVMICITCVDAMLATDMERVCKKAQEACGILVRPCYMYALTREGRKPPMVHVRQSIYSMLGKRKRRSTSCNLLGFFASLSNECELTEVLARAGMKNIRQISTCGSFEEFEKMSEANFNLVLNREALPAAIDMEKNLGIPSIELRRLYKIEKIRSQYFALGNVLGFTPEIEEDYDRAKKAVERFRSISPDAVFSVGECLNGDSFELANALLSYGFGVREIFAAVTEDSYLFIRQIAERSPDTRIYSNLHPSTIYYDGDLENASEGTAKITITIGKDAGYYHPDLPGVDWNTDIQPYGFQAVTELFNALTDALLEKNADKYSSSILLEQDLRSTKASEEVAEDSEIKYPDIKKVKGFRSLLTPFAPDQSGAAGVFFNMNAVTLIADAGGCTGNICGFDEPRWFENKSAVFSAGLRDMDAIMGRDEQLIQKLQSAVKEIRPDFAVVIGTPVPAVIGTDFHALAHMAERKLGIPVIAIDTYGMKYYDKGAEKAYLALFEKFANESFVTGEDNAEEDTDVTCAGVIGAAPLDLLTESAERITGALRKEGFTKVHCYGINTGIREVSLAGKTDINIVCAPAGIKAAKYLEKTYGTPWKAIYPGIGEISQIAGLTGDEVQNAKILVVHQQIAANSIRERLLEMGAAKVCCASYFMKDEALMDKDDRRLKEEDDFRELVLAENYDIIIADKVLRASVPEYEKSFIDLPHFALSGRLPGRKL